ncbi:MAG: CPBP family intramembrane metalloprotease [Desulfobacteraceae bacterium]|nr:CPBP family intramembrane metalloprotease [Desulfobacteraceae bacterium]
MALTARSNLIVVSVLLLVVLGPCFGPVPRYLNSVMSLHPASASQLVAFCAALAIVIAWAWTWLKRTGRTWADVGWRRPAGWGPILVGTIVGILWGLMGMMGYRQLDPQADLFEMSVLRVFTALIGAGAAVCEDLVTRGLVMEELHRMGRSAWVQVGASSLLFALYHSVWWGNPYGAAASFTASLVYGLMLSGLFIWGKRSLTPVILAHSLALIVGEPFLTMSMMLSARG